MSDGAPTLPDTGRLAPDDAKEQLRTALRDRRRSRHPHDRAHGPACHALTEHALEAVAGAGCVAAFVSTGAEPCTRLLLESLHTRGVRVLLPALGPQLARSWAEYRGASDLGERAPGRPPEPGGEALDSQALAQADAVLLPALAVDRAGRRLGQGGGWYDRVLPLRRPGVPTFAVLHPDELVPGPLPTEEHDQPVEAVITAEQWFLLEGSQFASGS
ncbi:5-formyltetrahydrofolate cyclo-ligase [Actinomyces slackii]|uniref:5-formyltetrahydrofolate cyclo-ligase n=1 Tax=Actinomyces slackii TaxID=52774 RepID=A0A448KBG4_9ACTO|nr:5-formyltetrahydrofolate cyclo-ligase [Actinomyces slackii]VEG74251.1 5-formyltetrahydrofolate cyclo-ligase family protein [Actinomyces slackii]